MLGALGGMKAGWGQSLERLGDLVGGGGKMDLEIGDRVIVLTRAFDAPREQVWRALTDADVFGRWWCAGESVVEEMGVRPGGKSECPPDLAGRVGSPLLGRIPPDRTALASGHDPGVRRLSRGEIEVVHTPGRGVGPRTVLTRTMTFPDNTYRDGMLQSGLGRGAAHSYDALAELLTV